MQAVREKCSTAMCSVDLQLLEVARVAGLPTDATEAAADSGAPQLMKQRNQQWAELLQVRGLGPHGVSSARALSGAGVATDSRGWSQNTAVPRSSTSTQQGFNRVLRIQRGFQ